MAQGQGRSGSPRLVQLTPEAEDDRLLTYIYTEGRWDTDQADAYDQFLQDVMQELAARPTSAPAVPDYPGLRRHTARWPGSRDGHYIFFEETPQGIAVIRILHTSMQWQAHL